MVARRVLTPVGERITLVAMARGISLDDLPAMAGVSKPTLLRLMHEPDRRVQLRTLDRIAAALGVPTSRIAAGGRDENT